ncbi:MAG: hypothetical protein GF349_00065 [Candidatus Magasanikbacteria bacterium]|nr:hypothetical protein [Candidatus Magasanikbacteria bacterium]
MSPEVSMLPYRIRQFNKNRKITAIVLIVGIFLLIFTFFVVNFDIVNAQTEGDALGVEIVDESGLNLGGGDIRIIIARIIRAVLGFLGIIALIIVIYAGFTIMTSAGNEEKVARGKKLLINGAIGLAIILSAFAITQFVLSSLQRATGAFPGGGGGITRPAFNTFSGSGSLGRIVKDHYPERNQTDVKRNTKIAFTFREAIDASSLIEDSNQNGIIGDCIVPDDGILDWSLDCDQLNQNAVRLYRSTTGTVELLPAAAMASYEGDASSTYTFVLRPLEMLEPDTWYSVDLTENILIEDGETSAFVNERSGHYLWEFETGSNIDFDPPTVSRVYPRNERTVSRNSIIRIDFSEAMDPTAVQGLTENFTNIILDAAENSQDLPAGKWSLTNSYKTVEFVSAEQCGTNSCGDAMYCLPIFDCAVNDSECLNFYLALIRTAQIYSEDSFEAVPFSGVMDMAGNALDGNADGVVDGKPNVPDNREISGEEQEADNYLWRFIVQNNIDRSIPFISEITPPVDAENVPANTPIIVHFNKEMWSSTFSDVVLEEYPANYCLPDDPDECLDDIWFHTYTEITEDGGSDLYITHREFGANNLDLFYFPTIPSTVKSLNQQCLYPGRGPAEMNECQVVEDEFGNIIETVNCVNVSFDEENDTGCAQTMDEGASVVPDNEQCLDYLRSLVP